MAISVAVPVGKAAADRLMEKLIPRVDALKIVLSTDPSADYGPLVTQAAVDRVHHYCGIGIAEGADLVVDGRGFKMQGYEQGFYVGSCLFDNVTKDMRNYTTEEIFGPVLSVVRAKTYKEGLALCNDHEYGNGVAIFTRDGDALATSSVRCRWAWSASTCRSRRRSPTIHSAAGSARPSARGITFDS